MGYKLRRSLQFSAEPQRRWNHHRLAAKMLVRALLDVATVSKQEAEIQNKKDALRWMRSSDYPDYIFSFNNCCNMLKLNSERLLQIAFSCAHNSSDIPRPIDPSTPLEQPLVPDSPVLGLPLLLALIRDRRRVLGSQTDYED